MCPDVRAGVWAYSIVAERLHGMEEVGVRFPLGPQGGVAEWLKAAVLKTAIRETVS
jgi:hypothetical protein